jgi:hypothetical protein
VIDGLTLPFLTSADPDVSQEGSLDPLGMGGIATLLADEIAPEVTARMSRIRFITAIAVGSRVLEQPVEWAAEDGTPAYLALEWVVVESFARARATSDLVGVPGIQKARRAVRSNAHLGTGGRYLAAPKVFGFHGVYKRLAIDLAVVDAQLELLPGPGEELVLAWGADQDIQVRDAHLRGDLRRLQRDVGQALDRGQVQLPRGSGFWAKVARWFAPDGAGRRERQLIWRWLSNADGGEDVRWSLRAELVRHVGEGVYQDLSERDLARALAESPAISGELRARLRAIDAFEEVAIDLDEAFAVLRAIASPAQTTAVAVARIADDARIAQIASALPAKVEAARDKLAPVGLTEAFESELGMFGAVDTGGRLVDELLARHRDVQARKGARPWFNALDAGVLTRGPGVFHEEPTRRSGYVHPYRLAALRSFVRDLRPERGW